MHKSALGAAAALCLLSAGGASAAELIVVDGQLTGANGVTFDDRVFDVQFVDGTCAGLFDGCDSEDDFILGDRFEARAAARSLLEQVVVGMFDERPELTSGCDDLFGCQLIVPYYVENLAGDFVNEFGQSLFGQYSALNRSIETFDSVGARAQDRLQDTTDPTFGRLYVFAQFTERSAVPEPASWAMMLLGFFGIGGVMRRRRKTPARLRHSFD